MNEGTGTPRLVLASASLSRLTVLQQAGLAVVQDPAGVDEDMVKQSLGAEGADAAHVAETLADLKAKHVSRRHAGAFVVGADQMLECKGVWYDKPVDSDQARAHLTALRNESHELITAAVVVRDGASIWRHVARARLSMRPFSDAFLDRYLAQIGDDAYRSVGAYQLEGMGAQLFDKIEGDYFTILGLPLLPLLDFLRGHGIVAE